MPRGANALAVARMAITTTTTYCIVEGERATAPPFKAVYGVVEQPPDQEKVVPR